MFTPIATNRSNNRSISLNKMSESSVRKVKNVSIKYVSPLQNVNRYSISPQIHSQEIKNFRPPLNFPPKQIPRPPIAREINK